MFSGYIGYIASIDDEYHAERVKAVIPIDKGKPMSKIPYAFPLMPKMIHIKPKVGEAVIILIPGDGSANLQRYYIGPIISQPQKMLYDGFASLSATKLLNGGIIPPENSVDNKPLSAKVLPKDDEIAIIGRKDTEIILSDEDIRLRCGVRVTDKYDSEVSLNGKASKTNETVLSDSSIRTAPAFIKLKYHIDPIKTAPKEGEINSHKTTLSTATIVADKINLISQNGDGGFGLTGEEEAITDKKMAEIIEKAHCQIGRAHV